MLSETYFNHNHLKLCYSYRKFICPHSFRKERLPTCAVNKKCFTILSIENGKRASLMSVTKMSASENFEMEKKYQ